MTESESQFDKLDRIVETQVRENEEIKALVSQSASQKTTLEIGGLKLQVPGVIPRKIRHDLARVQKKGNNVDMEEIEGDTYYLLSIICQNEPYNHPETWEYIDNETGLALDILREVLDKGFGNEDKLKNFRRK